MKTWWKPGNIIPILVLSAFIGSCNSKPSQDSVNAPEGMAYIPAGEFIMGGRSAEAYPNEFPQHKVSVSGFYMDATEVTNAQFQKFVEATAYITAAEKALNWEELKAQFPPGAPKPADSLLQAGSMVFKPTDGPVDLSQYLLWWEWRKGAHWKAPEGPGSSIKDRMDHPVVHLAIEDVIAYCQWADKRLPTEAEWEWAALGGNSSNKYPWGNESIEKAFDKANFWQGPFPWKNLAADGFAGIAPVKSFPPNGYGLFDMAGNVWEWCADKYSIHSYAKDHQNGLVHNPKGPQKAYDPQMPQLAHSYVVRGGSFLCNDDYCSGYRTARRMGADGKAGAIHTGFRCVKDISAY